MNKAAPRRYDPRETDGKVTAQWKRSLVDIGDFEIYDYKSGLPCEQETAWSVKCRELDLLLEALNADEITRQAEEHRQLSMMDQPELFDLLKRPWNRATKEDWEEWGDDATRIAQYEWWTCVLYENDTIKLYDAKRKTLEGQWTCTVVEGSGTGALAPGAARRAAEAERAAWAAAAGGAD